VHYVAHEHLAASKQRCSYEGCRRPEESHKFHQIDAGSEAGGRNWAELAGRVLCDACYNQFRSHGTLERTGLRSESLSAADRICSYEGCKMPRKSSKFYRIELGTKAGGRVRQVWSLECEKVAPRKVMNVDCCRYLFKQWLAWIVAAIDGSYDERPLQPLFIEAWTSVGL
jgi:hypothetical protein